MAEYPTISREAREMAKEAFLTPPNGVTRMRGYEERIISGSVDTDWPLQAIQAALDLRRAPMTEDEIMQRARRAATARGSLHIDYTDGKRDNCGVVQAAAQALRDLDKPLVDPVVLACREICASAEYALGNPPTAERYRQGDYDEHFAMKAVIAAYRAGQATSK